METVSRTRTHAEILNTQGMSKYRRKKERARRKKEERKTSCVVFACLSVCIFVYVCMCMSSFCAWNMFIHSSLRMFIRSKLHGPHMGTRDLHVWKRTLDSSASEEMIATEIKKASSYRCGNWRRRPRNQPGVLLTLFLIPSVDNFVLCWKIETPTRSFTLWRHKFFRAR